MSDTDRNIDVTIECREPFGAPFMLALATVSGPDRHAVHRISSAETRVGRSPDADFTVRDPLVSEFHFNVRVDGSRFSLGDLESRNGTKLNGRTVTTGTRVVLKNFDEIELGMTRLVFVAYRFRSTPV